MKIDRKSFLEVMRRVGSVTKSSRTTLPILSTVKLSDQDGQFTAIGTDMDLYVSAKCECEGELDTLCISPGPIMGVCGYGPDQISLSVVGERLRVVSCSTASLSVHDAKEFPRWPKDMTVDLGVNPLDLADCIESVAWAADGKSQRGILHQCLGVQMSAKIKGLVASACGGPIMSYIHKPAIVPEDDFIIQSVHAPIMCEALRGEGVAVRTDKERNWLLVESKAFSVAIKQVDSAWFPLKVVLEAESTEVGEIPHAEFIQAIATMCSMGGIDFVYGTLKSTKEGLVLDYEGRTNEFHAVVANSTMGNPIQAKFDAALLHDLLKNTPGPKVKLSVNQNQIRIVSGDLINILSQVRT